MSGYEIRLPMTNDLFRLDQMSAVRILQDMSQCRYMAASNPEPKFKVTTYSALVSVRRWPIAAFTAPDLAAATRPLATRKRLSAV
jgi:hypothetical protein